MPRESGERPLPDQVPFSRRFQKGPPHRGSADRGSPLSTEEKQFILFRTARGGLPRARIARELGVARSTVSAFMTDLYACPSLLLLLDLYRLFKRQDSPSGRPRTWFLCYLCGTEAPGGAGKVRTHLALCCFRTVRLTPQSAGDAEYYLLSKRDEAYWARKVRKESASPRGLLSRLLGR